MRQNDTLSLADQGKVKKLILTLTEAYNDLIDQQPRFTVYPVTKEENAANVERMITIEQALNALKGGVVNKNAPLEKVVPKITYQDVQQAITKLSTRGIKDGLVMFSSTEETLQSVKKALCTIISLSEKLETQHQVYQKRVKRGEEFFSFFEQADYKSATVKALACDKLLKYINAGDKHTLPAALTGSELKAAQQGSLGELYKQLPLEVKKQIESDCDVAQQSAQKSR